MNIELVVGIGKPCGGPLCIGVLLLVAYYQLFADGVTLLLMNPDW